MLVAEGGDWLYTLEGGGGGGTDRLDISGTGGYWSPLEAAAVGTPKPASIVAPQFEQNRWPGVIGEPHWGQNVCAIASLLCSKLDVSLY